MYNSKFTTLSALLLLFTTSVFAEPVSVVLSAVTLDKRIKNLKFSSGGAVQALSVFPRQRSKSFIYNGSQTITFFRESKRLDLGGDAIRTIVAKAHIPNQSGQYLLLFATKTATPEAYRVIVIPDDWSDFKVGTYRFLNLAPFEIALKINEDIHQIKAQNFTDVVGDFNDGSHQQAVMISLPKDHEPQRIFDGFIYFTEQQRMLYIITPKGVAGDGNVNFLAIPQVASAEPLKQ